MNEKKNNLLSLNDQLEKLEEQKGILKQKEEHLDLLWMFMETS